MTAPGAEWSPQTSPSALLGLMLPSRWVAAYDITCNAILPDSVRRLSSKVGEEEQRAGGRARRSTGVVARAAPSHAGRLVTDAEVASAVRFVVSDETSGVNGETLGVGLEHCGVDHGNEATYRVLTM